MAAFQLQFKADSLRHQVEAEIVQLVPSAIRLSRHYVIITHNATKEKRRYDQRAG